MTLYFITTSLAKLKKNVKQQEFLYTAGRSMETTFEASESVFLVLFIISSILYLKENKITNMETDQKQQNSGLEKADYFHFPEVDNISDCSKATL